MEYWKRFLNVTQVVWLTLALIIIIDGQSFLNAFILYGLGLGVLFLLGYATTGKWEIWYFTGGESGNPDEEPEPK